jgi:isopenicillin-N N-acyltransferase-like protein
VRLSGRLVIPLTLMLFALLSWLPSSTPTELGPVSAEAERRYGEGCLEEREGLRILHLRGTPYEMGYQHGVLLRHEIRTGLWERIYERLILEEGVPHLLLLRHARHVDDYLASEYREEMRGLADGAGISYSDVLLLNSFYDLISQPSPGQGIRDLLLALHPPFIPPLGSVGVLSVATLSPENNSTGSVLSLPLEMGFAAFGKATEDSGLLEGLDFTSPQLSLGDILLIVYQPQVGNSFVALAWPGAVGATIGLNEEKISVAELASPSQDASLEGVPLSFLLRDVLEYAGDIQTAWRLVAGAGRTIGHNVVIGDGKPADAQTMEFSAHLYAVFEAENDLIVRTNHYLDPALSETQQIPSRDEYESSQARFEAVSERLASDHGRLGLSGIINLLSESNVANGQVQENVLGVVIASSDLELWVISVVYPEGTVVKRSLRLDEEL